MHATMCRPLSFVIARLLALSPSTNALVATTVAVTSVQTTGTNNVLPQHGTALLNFRHLPGGSPDCVMFPAFHHAQSCNSALLIKHEA